MAKAYFNCAHCGESVMVIGQNRNLADRLAEYREQQGALCHDCWAKQQADKRAEASQHAAEQAVVEGLPVLQGSEKQVAWAESIRQDKLGKLTGIEKEIDDCIKAGAPDGSRDVLLDGVACIKAVDSAHWWIENRDARLWWDIEYFTEFLCGGSFPKTPEAIIARAKAHMGGLRFPQECAPAEIVADAKTEATIRPESPKTETIAEVLIVGQEVHISFPEKREDFRLLMRDTLNMQWKEGYWGRRIDGMAGTLDDRMIEAGHRLLAAGFIIRIYDAEARAKAVAGEFEPEHTRWITRRSQGKRSGWFALVWGKHEDYYAPARKLPGAAYDKPYVVVAPEHFEEVIDFGGRYDFRITQSGQELAERSRVNRDAALVAKVDEKPKAKGKRIEQANKPTAMMAPDSEDLDDDLRDA